MTLKVIGAGYPRTGTASLKAALDQLGLGPCYHMSELLTHPGHWQVWVDAVAGKPTDWDTLFDGYRSTADVPGCLFFRELATHYPEAKLVLTTRDPEAWFASTQATVLAPVLGPIRAERPPVFLEMMTAIGWNGAVAERHDKDLMIAEFIAHNDAVVRDTPAERLLVWEPSDGWEPLCTFLEVPVPVHQFPRINSTEAFKAMTKEMMGDLTAVKRSHAAQAAAQREGKR